MAGITRCWPLLASQKTLSAAGWYSRLGFSGRCTRSCAEAFEQRRILRQCAPTVMAIQSAGFRAGCRGCWCLGFACRDCSPETRTINRASEQGFPPINLFTCFWDLPVFGLTIHPCRKQTRSRWIGTKTDGSLTTSGIPKAASEAHLPYRPGDARNGQKWRKTASPCT